MESEASLKRPAFAVLIVTTIIFGLMLTPSIFFALMSIRLFETPGTQQIATWILALSILTFPLICSFSIFFSWIAYWLKGYKTAIVLGLLPIGNMVLFLISASLIK
jgi:hypothetical protein